MGTEWSRYYFALALVRLRETKIISFYHQARAKVKLEQLPCEQFSQAFEICRALLRAKQVEEKRAKIQNPVKSAHKAVVLIFLSL